MSGFDADFLYAESPTWLMHVGALMIFDPSTAPGGFGVGTWRDLLAAQIGNVPPFRERLVEVPYGLAVPGWVEDPGFDLDAHVHHVAVPAPGSREQLATLLNRVMSRRLDRSRPLWETWFVEGLEDGNVAVLTKVHHAILDGMAGALLMGSLFTLEPTAPPSPPPAPDPGPEAVGNDGPGSAPSDFELLRSAMGALALTPVRAIGPLRNTVRALALLAGRTRSDDWATPALPFAAPRTPMNRRVTRRRSIAWTAVPIEDVKEVKDALGVTMNDVILTVVGGALRAWLRARGELPETPLIAAVPVSTRTEEDAGSWGNMVSGLFAALGTDIEDPVERVRSIRDGTERAKGLYASGIEDVVIDWAEVPFPAVTSLGIRLLERLHVSERVGPIFNLLVSNVPGPPVPLYAGGARLVAIHPLGPVLDSFGLNLTVLSHVDEVGFGFVSCPENVPDLWALADAVAPALEDLVSAVRS